MCSIQSMDVFNACDQQITYLYTVNKRLRTGAGMFILKLNGI